MKFDGKLGVIKSDRGVHQRSTSLIGAGDSISASSNRLTHLTVPDFSRIVQSKGRGPQMW